VTYRNARLQAAQSTVDKALEPSQEEVTRQRKAVEDAHALLLQERDAAGIADPEPENGKVSLPELNPGKPSEKYARAKQQYLASRQQLEAAELKLTTERINQNIAADPVKIWERAAPPSRPVSAFQRP
jgi:hypothetical protein